MRNIKFYFAVIFISIFLNGCILALASPESCSMTSSCEKSNIISTLFPFLLTSSSNNTSTATTTTSTGNSVRPTIQYPSNSYTLTVGVSSTLTPSVSGSPITNCTATPSLPLNLSISNNSCVISGTLASAQSAVNYIITVSNASGSTSVVLSITGVVTGTAPTITYSGSPFTYNQNAAIATLTPSLSGNTPSSCTASPTLPTGLALNGTTCVISGTPTGTQTATNHIITATNAYGSGQATINITVSAAGVAPGISYSGSPFTYTQNTTISNLSPTLTGNSPTSCTASPSLPTGLSIHNTTCVISGTPTNTQASTNHTITATNAFGSGQYIINITVNAAAIAPTISYSGSPFTFTQNSAITTLNASLTGNSPTSCTASPVLPAGLSIHATTCAISGTPTGTQAATSHTITATNGAGNGTTSIQITVGTSPTISYAGSSYTLTANIAVTPISATLTGNSLTSCTISPSLPSGLSINATTCDISGTPTATQTLTHTITATNPFGTGTATLQIIVGTSPSLSYTGSPFVFTQNSAITTLTPSLSGNALSSCTSSPGLPTGLTINNTTCVISGTPTGTQSATNHTITATNPYGNTTATLNITVVAANSPPTLSYPGSPYSLPVGAVPFPSWTVNLTGNPLISCVSTPSLPSGFSLNNSTCQIGGTANSSFSATNFTIRATNAYGFIDTVISITATP